MSVLATAQAMNTIPACRRRAQCRRERKGRPQQWLPQGSEEETKNKQVNDGETHVFMLDGQGERCE